MERIKGGGVKEAVRGQEGKGEGVGVGVGGGGVPLAHIEEYSYSSIAQSVKFRHSRPNEKFVPKRPSSC